MSQDAPSWTTLPPRNLHPSLSNFIVQYPPVLPASASASAGPRTGRTGARRRYPQEVYDLLSDYYTNVNKYPTKQELRNLVAQIITIPGCEDYNADKAYTYFAGKRQQNGDARGKTKKQGRAEHEPKQPQQPTSAEILYPSLAKEMSVLAKLDVLLTETPNPTDDIVKIWATRIGKGVWPEDIKTYAALKRARRPSEDAVVQPPPRALSTTASHLPTPESSISPEPHSAPTSPVVESSWGKVELEEDVKDQLVSDEEDEEDEPSTTHTQNEVQPGAQSIPGPPLSLIAEELSKALYSPPEDGWTKPQMKFKDVTRWLREEGSANAFLERLGKSAPRQPVPSLPRRPPTPIGGRVST